MSWEDLKIAPDCSHHITADGFPVYAERFDDVLKFHPPGLAPVQRGVNAWHIGPDGTPAYPRRFMRTFGFYEGLAAVNSQCGWHHITPDGGDAYEQRYAWCGNFQGGRCTVREPDGTYRHINADGRAVYSERWRYAGDYRDGVAVVQDSDGRSTHIGLDGCRLHDRWFIDLDVFHKGFARARDRSGWTHVDMSGVPLYANRFAAVEPFYNGQARVERFDGALEVIDETGAVLVELRPAQSTEFSALSADMVGFWKTQAIAAAVRLGVVEALPCSEKQVAERCGLRLDSSHRLLRALGELQLATRQEKTWQLTARGTFLRADHPSTLADAALEYAGPFSRMWEQLPNALRKDAGWSAPDIFGEVARDEPRCTAHHRMLRSYARHDYPSVVSELQLQGNERIIDAAGGVGSLADMLLSAYPSAQVTVLDRPEVIEQGRRELGWRSGIHWHAGNIFEPWRLSADVVLLARVLHDWDDEAAGQILSRARAALPVGGLLFIIEMLIPDGSVSGALCDLHLLTVTGGRERTLIEFKSLLGESGFELMTVRTVSALPSILVGVAT